MINYSYGECSHWTDNGYVYIGLTMGMCILELAIMDHFMQKLVQKFNLECSEFLDLVSSVFLLPLC